MSTFAATCKLTYTPALINPGSSESSVSYEWEMRNASTNIVESSGSGACIWNGTFWSTGTVDVGDAPTVDGSNIYYRFNASDNVPGVDISATTGWLFGKFVEYNVVTLKCYSIGDSPLYWSSDTYVEEGWTEVTVPSADSGLDSAYVRVKGFLMTDSYADVDTTLVIEKGSTTHYISLPDAYYDDWTSDYVDFSAESTDGTWKIYFSDSSGDGGAEIINATLCIGHEPFPVYPDITTSEVSYNTQDDGQFDGDYYWVNLQLSVPSDGFYNIYTTDPNNLGVDSYLEIWENTLFSGNMLSYNDDNNGTLAELIGIYLQSGITYGVRLRLFSGQQTTDQIGIYYEAQP